MYNIDSAEQNRLTMPTITKRVKPYDSRTRKIYGIIIESKITTITFNRTL